MSKPGTARDPGGDAATLAAGRLTGFLRGDVQRG